MRLIPTIIFCAVIASICAGPEPKKYKADVKEKDKKLNTTLTDEERKFLREVETKFGIRVDEDSSKDEPQIKNVTGTTTTPFPAIIAIEIVNDTDSKSKGKRTIDANLGYGYKTNNGYSYSYFGKGAQEKGKFMIYPYSQQDIPASPHHGGSHELSGRYTTVSTKVEIQPSRAFELVQVKDEKNAYPYKGPINGQRNNYNNFKGLVSPPPVHPQIDYTQNHTPAPYLSTLYTTYNGKGFSGLSGQFPTVMPNYFVDPSQLLKYPEYKSAGLTTDHLHNLQDSKTDHRVVPVLVLRIPSSSLKNPTAELFANLPENYPLSRYLNNVNLQELVNQYFKKMGYNYAPPVMRYQDSLSLKPAEATAAALTSHYEPQQYAAPYVQPSYTHADFSGVQYSAVKPVMARYPSSYTRQQYYTHPGHSLYQQPMRQQNYEYRYQYVPQSAVPTQTYYVQPQYQHHAQQSHQATSQEVGHEDAAGVGHHAQVQDTSAEVEYTVPSQVPEHGSAVAGGYEYTHPQTQVETQYEARTPSPEYGVPAEKTELESQEYETSKAVAPVYGPPKEEADAQQYFTAHQPAQKEAAAVYQTQDEQTAQKYYSEADSGETQYVYQQQAQQHEVSDNNLVISENYPSRDHTIATVLPLSYKTRQPSNGPIQTVTYVTPMPYSYKYQSPYKVMIPQTYLKNPDSEKVAYVNSQTFTPTSHAQAGVHQDQNPEAEYTLPAQYIPPVGKQKPPTFPRNYHSHPKRMTRPENKPENVMHSKKQSSGNEKRKAS